MFAVGLPALADSYFMAASMVIAIPSGIQIFCWIATIGLGRPRWDVPMLWMLGFIVTFVLGGLTGVMLASVPLDTQLHDSYFVVAHFHYVLIGGAVMPLFGGFHYWFPKITGRRLSEALGRWQFGLFLAGFHLAFFPMHLLGLAGMPRRVYTYPGALGWNSLNLLASLGAVLLVASVLLLLINVVRAVVAGQPAGANPWNAPTLEWATTSPPASYNFAHLPVVHGREPLWDERNGLAVVHGLRVDERELILTSLVEAAPEVREPSPKPSIWPLLAPLATTGLFVGSIFAPWAVVRGAIPVAVTLTGWFWPKERVRRDFETVEA